MTALATPILVLHVALLTGLGLLALHRARLAWAARHADVRAVPPLDAVPTVTVQLPLFNEREVAVRIVQAAGALRWPADRLEIQVLDDSTDDTTARAAAAVGGLRARGLDAVLLHRADRTGFKAGALAAGLRVARGEVIAILDADFLPPEDWLERVVPWLGPGVAVVQARWGHLNADESWLTRVQATLLDGHFVLEHAGRQALGAFFNFNGTAGIWRKAAIEQAGGWAHDTLTEDLDLSYRAQLAGWRFVYRDEVVVPAELPPTLRAFKAQQARWARGGVQTARKLLLRVLRAPLAPGIKLEAVSHLLGNLGYPLTLVLALLLPVLPWAREAASWRVPLAVDVVLFVLCVVPMVGAYAVAVWRSGHGSLARRLGQLPLVLAVGVGMSAAQTQAVWRGVRGEVGTFERTPKRGTSRVLSYGVRSHGSWGVELLLAGWQLVGIASAPAHGGLGAVPFLALFAVGFGLVGLRTAWESLGAAGS